MAAVSSEAAEDAMLDVGAGEEELVRLLGGEVERSWTRPANLLPHGAPLRYDCPRRQRYAAIAMQTPVQAAGGEGGEGATASVDTRWRLAVLGAVASAGAAQVRARAAAQRAPCNVGFGVATVGVWNAMPPRESEDAARRALEVLWRRLDEERGAQLDAFEAREEERLAFRREQRAHILERLLAKARAEKNAEPHQGEEPPE